MRFSIQAALLASSSCFALSCAPATASSFTNGGFENGTFSGWTTGTGYRGNVDNPSLNPSDFLPNGTLNNPSLSHSAVVNTSYMDPYLGSKLGSTVYSGNYSARVEDTVIGGYASVIQQQVSNYTDASIFFAYKAVLDGAHGASDAATMQVLLKDTTTGAVLYNQQYNAASGGTGVNSQFTQDISTGAFYTPNWQIVQLNTPIQGDTYLLQVLAADCQPTGHYGYVYLDGFGSVTPPPVISPVPLPASLPMFGIGILALGTAAGVMRSRRMKANVAC